MTQDSSTEAVVSLQYGKSFSANSRFDRKTLINITADSSITPYTARIINLLTTFALTAFLLFLTTMLSIHGSSVDLPGLGLELDMERITCTEEIKSFELS